MKKIVLIISIILTTISLTGCGKKEETNKENNINKVNENEVINEEITYEGLEFVNVGASNGIIKTVVINNSGSTHENIKFTMKVMDENGNVITEITDEVKKKMANGTTETIETKTDVDLSKAVSIEYSIVK